ncbi:MATE family efflux transporter [Paenibacillus farraposensis]|uniref:MATE family efflux transporter n=1 Tax=Paenibacillus farraposensis TaxID=2807095 RepID=UPI003616A169
MQQLTLFRLTLPIFLDAFFHIVLGNVDTLMLSHYSEQAVAAVGISSQVFAMFIFILEFMAMGSGILIAQMLGAGHRDRASHIANSSVYLNSLIGSVLIFVLFSRRLSCSSCSIFRQRRTSSAFITHKL